MRTVRVSRARTNIELDDEKLATVMRRYGVRTKTEAVELALGHLALKPMSTEEALSMEGAHAISELPVDTSPLG